jgi:hypothetical protein
MAGQPFNAIVNTSILQTMTRSVNTLATVVVTLVALLALGGASLQNFAFALLVGLCSGGYHSIFYSAPLVAKLQNAQKLRLQTASTALDAPRTKAEARLQSAKAAGTPGSADRDAVIAARKARKERERLATGRNGAPARYKRRRPDVPASAVGVVEPELAHPDDEIEEYIGDGEHLDPLDAQTSGQHDLDYELGHEEIRLNLDAVDAPHVVPPTIAPNGEASTPPPGESAR